MTHECYHTRKFGRRELSRACGSEFSKGENWLPRTCGVIPSDGYDGADWMTKFWGPSGDTLACLDWSYSAAADLLAETPASSVE